MGDVIFLIRNKEDKCMISIYDAAKYFLSKESMSHLKLQKMCYYAQAWSCALKKEPIFQESFQAWVHGPVSYSLYSKYKQWGWYNIPQYCGDLLDIQEECRTFLDKIYALYGDYSGSQLEQLTHNEDPWKNARMGYDENAYCSIVIKEKDMAQYYSNLLRDS